MYLEHLLDFLKEGQGSYRTARVFSVRGNTKIYFEYWFLHPKAYYVVVADMGHAPPIK